LYSSIFRLASLATSLTSLNLSTSNAYVAHQTLTWYINRSLGT
jgi:hypothetical protein